MLNYYSWWVVGGSEKNKINAILNSKLKLELVEVGVELGNMQITFLKFDDSTFTNSCNLQMNEMENIFMAT